MRIENQTLVHFRHFRHFSSLLTIFPSTLVERALQIDPFLTNKANFQKSQIYVTAFITMNYGKMDTWSSGKNKPNTNPIQTQYKANTNPIQSQFKPKQTQFVVSLPALSAAEGSNLFPNFQKQYFLIAISGKNKYAHIFDSCGNRVRNNYLKGHIMTYLPIAVLSINFCCFLFEPFLILNKNLRSRFLKMPVFFQKLFVFVHGGPLFVAPIIPQSRFNISNVFALPIGIVLFILGWIIIIFAFFKIGAIPGVRKKSNLVTSGIYSVIRHPISSGGLISVLGWTILFKSIISMIYFPLLCLFYIVGTLLEEKNLIYEYGDQYLDYKKKVTKRLIPFIL